MHSGQKMWPEGFCAIFQTDDYAVLDLSKVQDFVWQD